MLQQQETQLQQQNTQQQQLEALLQQHRAQLQQQEALLQQKDAQLQQSAARLQQLETAAGLLACTHFHMLLHPSAAARLGRGDVSISSTLTAPTPLEARSSRL